MFFFSLKSHHPAWLLTSALCLSPGWPWAALTTGSAGNCLQLRFTTRCEHAATQSRAQSGTHVRLILCYSKSGARCLICLTPNRMTQLHKQNLGYTGCQCFVLPSTVQLTLYLEVLQMLKVEVFRQLHCWPELLQSAFTSGNLWRWPLLSDALMQQSHRSFPLW